MSSFELCKYLGVWYELLHYPSWFQRNDNYNTKAEYSLNSDGTVHVHNSTISKGIPFDINGTARYLSGTSLRVDFPIPDINNLKQSTQFNIPSSKGNQQRSLPFGGDQRSLPNYVIEKIWTNCYGQYIFAVVTDPQHESLYVLSRYPHPSLIAYNQIMEYVVENFDRNRLVQTPHYD